MASDFKEMLDELRRQLPKFYVNDLVKIINEDPTKPEGFSFNKNKVRNVFKGLTQDIESVAVVIGASQKLINKRTSLIKKGMSVKNPQKVA